MSVITISLIYTNNKKFIISQVLLLIKRGADILKNSSNGYSCLFDARDAGILDVLLKNGAIMINVAAEYYQLPHFTAFQRGDKNCMQIFLKYGADLSAVNSYGECFLQIVNDGIGIFGNKSGLETIIKELAILKFTEQHICQENLEYLQRIKEFSEYFEGCLKELKIMKNSILYNDVSFYDILQMRWRYKKLILLTKNNDFVAAFESKCTSETFQYFVEDLYDIFDNALKKSQTLQMEEEKLYHVFKSSLPSLIIRKVAYFSVL